MELWGRKRARAAEENDAALSVGELTARLKGIVEEAFSAVWVRGEISNLRQQASGHVYFTLKDADSQLAAVLFRGDALRQTVRLRDGMQIVAFGGVSVYAPRGSYQLVVRLVAEDGAGRLQREFEALKQKLAAEGLFDTDRKKPLPELPGCIGVITSPSGAAIQDFLRILARRDWRGRVVVLPARVQGKGAAEEIAAQLEWAGRREDFFDLLVVTRGGGSLEDLWCFNEERVVRAVRASAVPVISAVGHEIDFTLADFAADWRAETPSGAAEKISSGRLACVERLARSGDRFLSGAEEILQNARQRVERARAGLTQHRLDRELENGALRLDELTARLGSVAKEIFAGLRANCVRQEMRLQRQAPSVRMRVLAAKLEGLAARLQAVGVESTLRRGFALVLDGEGKLIRSKRQVTAGKKLRLRLHDGEAGAVGE